MNALSMDAKHDARDAAFTEIGAARFVRIVRIVPMCCNQPMLYTGGGVRRKRYYRCKACRATATGVTTREYLP